jgi:hypothetical protein
VCIVLYGTDYWNRILNLPALVDEGMLDAGSLKLLNKADSVEEAMRCLKHCVDTSRDCAVPDFAPSTTPRHPR